VGAMSAPARLAAQEAAFLWAKRPTPHPSISPRVIQNHGPNVTVRASMRPLHFVSGAPISLYNCRGGLKRGKGVSREEP